MSTGDAGAARTDLLGERVYQDVKTYVISVAQPGRRLDARVLADRERVSLTPVRAALHRLTGEGLVEAHLSSGFRAPPLSIAGLRDLYDWNRRVLLQAATGPPAAGLNTAVFKAPQEVALARDTALLFRAIARRQDNCEFEHAVQRLNDRLHRVRMFEPGVLGDGVEELHRIAADLNDNAEKRLFKSLQDYHERRLRAVGDILGFVDRVK